MIESNLSNLFMKRDAESRSISAENPTGERGKGGMATADTTLNQSCATCARELGQKWKVSPCARIPAGQTFTMMEVAGPAVIRHIWITVAPKHYRSLILRVYWDGQAQPSIECPLGDFFCQGWNKVQDIFALPINVNPDGGMNCFFPMPFRQQVRITVENTAPQDLEHFFYTVNYTLEEVNDTSLFFHAQWRRTNPLPYQSDYLMIDGIRGQGQYVGAFMCWQQNSSGWWGEGEIKMFLDGDGEFPTICGTGTEDYFGGAWGFGGRNYSSPYFGHQHTGTLAAFTHEPVPGQSRAGSRLTLYRFHIHDPVFFKENLKVTMQAIGWRAEGRYLPLQDDISSVVYWYQTLPTTPFPAFPGRDQREVI